MRTIKRNVNSIDTSLGDYDNIVKYFQQVEWKGIIENKNLFTTDQLSQADAKNVYVDSHGSLVSRPVLCREPLPTDILPTTSELVDFITYGKVKIYISKGDTYKITVVGTSTAILDNLQNYHISTIDNYIICFNNVGAKVFDINNQSKGWQDLSNFVEIPVVKRVIGSETTEYSKNQFTNQYKEEYIWSNASQPILPENKRANVVINTQDKWTLDQANILTDFRILKKVNYVKEDKDIVSMANGIICIGKDNQVLVSYDKGDTFTRYWYPNHGTFLGIASISDDGSSYFFVASDAVYRLDLGDGTWTVIYVHNESDKQIGSNWINVSAGYYGTINESKKLYHFLNKDTFAFMLWTAPSENNRCQLPILWFMGPWIAGYDAPPYDQFNDDNWIAPTMKEYQQIPEQYRGTLGCSVAFCRQPFEDRSSGEAQGSPFEYTSGHFDLNYDDRVCSPTFIKIFIDEGYVRRDMIFTQAPSSSTSPNFGTTENRQFASILCGIANNETHGATSQNATFLFVLPGYFCGGYVYQGTNFTEALDIKPFWNNRYYFDEQNTSISNLPPIGGYIGIDTTNKLNNSEDVWYQPKVASLTENSLTIPDNSRLTVVRFEDISRIANAENGNGSLYNITGKIYVGSGSEPQLTTDGWYNFTWTLGRPLNKSQSEILADGALENEITLSDQFVTIIYPGYNNYNYSVTFGQSDTPIQLDSSVGIANGILYYILDNNRSAQYVTIDNETDTNPWRVHLNLTAEKAAYVIIPDENEYMVILNNGEIYTTVFNDEDLAVIDFTFGDNDPYTNVPNVSYSNTELFLGFDNKLSITANSRDSDGNMLFNLPSVNDQKFIEDITNIINISTTDTALFFEDNIIVCSKVEDETLGYRYDYYPTKLSTGTRLGDSVINTIEGTYTIFPTKRGLAFMNYQAFMATTDQVLTYITDNIENRYDEFYSESSSIKIIQSRERIYLTNGTNKILIYDLSRSAWWYWELPNLINSKFQIKKLTTDQITIYVVGRRLFKFGEQIREYKDFEAINENDSGEDSWGTPLPQKINWYLMSQPLHLNALNYYKNLKQLIFQLLDTNIDSSKHTIVVQIQCYRKKLDTKNPEIITFKIDELRTFVKRFNYWKLNEVQYGLGSDNENIIPTKLKLNGISIKYELGEGVR